jgi:4-amino-4-deoxy-L-arabinose transferase-like glycosyltransferase
VTAADSGWESRRLEDLPREERVRLLWGTAIRIVVVVALMFVAYGIAPLDDRRDGETAARLLRTVGMIVIVVAWQLWAIHVARFPALRAIEGFALIVPLVLLGFAATYVRMAATNPDAFSQPLDRVGAVYFSMTIMATVGFGDIAATTDAARIAVMLQMAADVIVLVVVARVMVNSVRVQTGRSRDEPADRGGGASR